MNYAALAAAFVCGAALSFADYRILRFLMSRSQSNLIVGSFVRQLLNVAYLVLLFFIGQKTALDVRFLLIGGALGITIPAFFFASRLVKPDSGDAKDKEDENG